jgi:hypothetical protein
MLVKGLIGEAVFRAKKDKKGKKGQENSPVFLPLFALLVLFCFPKPAQFARRPESESALLTARP